MPARLRAKSAIYDCFVFDIWWVVYECVLLQPNNRISERMLQESITQKVFDRFSLDDALQDALIHNKEEFVHLFLEIGANLKTFLNEHRLHELYKQVGLPYLNKQLDLGRS